MSATFEAPSPGELRVADEQARLNETDVHFGAPDQSSVRYDADFAAEKRLFDVIVNGMAYAPGERAVTEVQVGIRVGRFQKVLIVSGDRAWRRSTLGMVPSSPEPFRRMPIVYERAYGGVQGEHYDARNPVGIGAAGAVSPDPALRSEVPNIERPNARLRLRTEQSEPAGFGVIARSWRPRVQFAGTYDEKWRTEQFPLVPHDLDVRFYQAAPSDQQLGQSVEGETLSVLNMTAEGQWTSRVPRLTVPLRLRYDNRVAVTEFRSDTLIVEPDAYRLTLKARARVPVHRNAPPLQEVVAGHASRAWWIARTSGKEFLGLTGAGRRGAASYFER